MPNKIVFSCKRRLFDNSITYSSSHSKILFSPPNIHMESLRFDDKQNVDSYMRKIELKL
jgi:hypothetical protein